MSLRCESCRAPFKTNGDHGRHLARHPQCWQYYDDLSTVQAQQGGPPEPPNAPRLREPTPDPGGFYPDERAVDAAEPPAKRRRVTVEEVEDEGDSGQDPWSHQPYPGVVGEILGESTTFFERIRAAQTTAGLPACAPFVDEEEWGLAHWLMTETTQGGADRYCKLPITRNRTKVSFKNKKSLLKKIDALPTGADWCCDIITVTGDRKGLDGEFLTEDFELWRRNPVEVASELMGNPALEDFITYEPTKVFKGLRRYYSEMNTADWWWDKQGKIPPGGVVAPVIVASDKTNLTVLRGDQVAWPVYLTLGNIDKAVRRQPSSHAFLLLGYIPVAKLACFSKSERSEALYRLFHHCMTKVLEPLIDAGNNGVVMTCADGLLRRVFLILAAYIADHPEQCLIACCKENRCPRCLVPRKERGDNTSHPLRSQARTAELLHRYGEGEDVPEFDEQGLRPVFKPFWADLPHTDIFACISPDILHQLHKGVIKDHVIKWCEKIVGKKALDDRFASLSQAHGLRHFGRGISMISQWTGAEAKEVEKVLLGLLVGRIPSNALRAIRALLDFTYYAQYQVHSDSTLSSMRTALDDFHRYKDALIELGVRKHFNIPKLHSLIHYVDAIQSLGCLDGFNTETSERLHIDLAKKAYRASNRREYIVQMTTWLQRQEAMQRRIAYLAWIDGELKKELDDEAGGGRLEQGDEEEDEEDEEDPSDVKALRELINSNVRCAYQVPLTPSARRVSVETITTSYGAKYFLDELNRFISTELPATPLAHMSSNYDIHHFITLLLPANIHFANEKRICKVRASPAVPRVGDKRAVQAHFDCGLFLEDEERFRAEGKFNGLRPGQVRVVFRLPADYGIVDPLVYVHWFRPLRTPDPVNGLPPTSHSTRHGRRNAEVLRVSDLVRTCHLIPRFGPEALDPDWTSLDILEEPIVFHLNRYFDFHTFHALSS